jgi:subtilisin family serine protease
VVLAAQRAAALAKLRAEKSVFWAEGNRPVQAATADPLFGSLWALENAGQSGGLPDADIDAEDAWRYTKGAGATVAVVDSGVQLDHPDLQFTGNPGERGGGRETDGIDNDGNTYVDDWLGWNWIAAQPRRLRRVGRDRRGLRLRRPPRRPGRQRLARRDRRVAVRGGGDPRASRHPLHRGRGQRRHRRPDETWLDGGYVSRRGTSMAAPHVSTVAALIFAAVPGITAAQVKDALMTSVDRPPLLVDKSLSGGRLNAAAALRAGGAVIPLPRTADECLKERWRTFRGFKNQGECVSFVVTPTRKP